MKIIFLGTMINYHLSQKLNSNEMMTPITKPLYILSMHIQTKCLISSYYCDESIVLCMVFSYMLNKYFLLVWNTNTDLALKIAMKYPDLVNKEDGDRMKGLQLLSYNSSAFRSGRKYGLLKRFIYYCMILPPTLISLFLFFGLIVGFNYVSFGSQVGKLCKEWETMY